METLRWGYRWFAKVGEVDVTVAVVAVGGHQDEETSVWARQDKQPPHAEP